QDGKDGPDEKQAKNKKTCQENNGREHRTLGVEPVFYRRQNPAMNRIAQSCERKHHRHRDDRCSLRKPTATRLPSRFLSFRRFFARQKQRRLEAAVRTLDFFAGVLLLKLKVSRAIGADAFG